MRNAETACVFDPHRPRKQVDMPSRTAAMPSRTDFRGAWDTSPRSGAAEPVQGRSAAVLGLQRAFARKRASETCSGRCGMRTSRTRRFGDLVARLELAERALADASIALAASVTWPSVSAPQLAELPRGEWIARADNIIFAGPIGTGKTHLASPWCRSRATATTRPLRTRRRHRPLADRSPIWTRTRTHTAPSLSGRDARARRARIRAFQLRWGRVALQSTDRALRATQRHRHHQSRFPRMGQSLWGRREEHHRAPRSAGTPRHRHRRQGQELPNGNTEDQARRRRKSPPTPPSPKPARKP